jgi:plastocyanin
MRNNQSRTALAIMVAVMAAGLVLLTAMVAVGGSHGDWGGMRGSGMWDHMQRMMGSGTNTSSAPLSVGGKSEDVTIRNFTFTPGNLQVPVGATVTWTNEDSAPHSATARDGSWDTGILGQGETKSITFDKAGVYEYYCTVHPSMVARLTVQ